MVRRTIAAGMAILGGGIILASTGCGSGSGTILPKGSVYQGTYNGTFTTSDGSNGTVAGTVDSYGTVKGTLYNTTYGVPGKLTGYITANGIANLTYTYTGFSTVAAATGPVAFAPYSSTLAGTLQTTVNGEPAGTSTVSLNRQ